MKNIEQLTNLLTNLEKGVDGYCLDFADDYGLNDNEYISDCISEFADKKTSIYYSDQKQFYYDNEDVCNETLIEFGYSLDDLLKEGDSLDDLICKAGQIGEFYSIESKLNNNLDDILKIMIIKYAIVNDLEIDTDIIENINCYDYDKFEDLLELFN